MQLFRLFVLGPMISISACESKTKLPDGCYYARGRPVLTVIGESGRVLLPGNIKSFKIIRHLNGQVTFAPGVLFDGNDQAPSKAVAFPDAPPLSMKPGTAVPTLQMHWDGYGDEDVSLGKPC